MKEADLKALLPEEPYLTTLFMQVEPAGEQSLLPATTPGDRPLADRVALNKEAVELRTHTVIGSYSRIVRTVYTRDGRYFVWLALEVCDSPATAHSRLLPQGASVVPRSGSLRSEIPLGDESWVGEPDYPAMHCRIGRTTLEVRTRISRVAFDQGRGLRQPFPADAIEALAHMMLLRAGHQPERTGASGRELRLLVNGNALAEAGCEVAKVVYVPVLPIARAAAWSASWDAKSGRLSLAKTGRPSSALQALSASVNGGPPTLDVPLLSEGGQPLMGLEDLLQLLGGKSTRAEGVLRIRL